MRVLNLNGSGGGSLSGPTIVYPAAGTGLDDAAPLRAIVAAATPGTTILLPSDLYQFRTTDSNSVCVPVHQPNIFFVGKGRTVTDVGIDPGTGGTTAIIAAGAVGNCTMFQWYADKGVNTSNRTSEIYGGGLSYLSVSGQSVAKYCVEIQGGVQGLRFIETHLAHCTDATVIGGTGVTHGSSIHSWHSTWDITFDQCVIRAFGSSDAVYLSGNPNVAGGESCYNWRFTGSTLIAVDGYCFNIVDADDIFMWGGSCLITGAGAATNYQAGTSTKSNSGARAVMFFGVFGSIGGSIARQGASGTIGSTRGNLIIGGGTEDSPGIPTIEKGAQLYYIQDGGVHNLRPDPRSCCLVEDDFMVGTNTTSGIGLQRWFLNAGTCAYIASEANHPGIRQLDTTAAAGTLNALYITGSGAIGILLPSEGFDATFIFRVNTVDADTMVRVGAMMSPTADPGNNGVFFEKVYADTNWFAVCRSGGVQTRTDTSTAVSAGTWVRARIRRRNGGAIGFSFGNTTNENDTWVLTTNVPTAALNIMFQIKNQAAASKTMDVDYAQLYINGLNR